MDNIQKINEEFYDRKAEFWSENKTNSFWHEDQFRLFVKNFKKGDKVIELGSAHGICVPLFLGIGRDLEYLGIDISENFIKIAKRRYPQLRFQKSNLLDYDTLPKGKFDGFWAPAVMMHIPEKDWPRMLENIEKIIRPGGYGYITLPQQRPNPENDDDKRFFSFWDLEKLKGFIEPRGWHILENGENKERVAQWLWFIVKLPE